MKIFKFNKKRAISPVVATVLLISLVVAASALVYFIVVPMLKGSANVDLITIQWFDSNGDSVVDVAYVTVQNTGTARAVINKINVTLTNPELNETILEGVSVENIEFPLEVEPTEKLDLKVNFDPVDLIAIGENTFQIRIQYDTDLISYAPENLKHIDVIEPLEFTVLSPIEGGWVSGIVDPQAIATGGFLVSPITYDFRFPNGTVALDDQPLTANIDSSDYSDASGYEIEYSVSDYLGQSSSITKTFGIDNLAIGVDLSLNNSIINPGEFIEASWVFDIAGASLINQTLVLSGTAYGYEQEFTSSEATVTNYVLTGSQTLQMAEDDLTFTIFVKDAAGNTNSSGQSFILEDNVAPTTYIISPENNTQASETITIQVYADDASGIDTENFDVTFIGYGTGYMYFYQQSVEELATYNSFTNTWTLEFNSYLLPDDNYSIITQVYDLSSNSNGGSATVDIIEIDNEVLNIYGASATDGRGGFFFRRRGILSFYVESKVPGTITITQMRMSWGGSGQITHIYTVYDDTIEQFWLSDSEGPISEDSNFPVAQASGGVNFTTALDHHLTIQFDYGDKPEGEIFTVSFYIEQLSAWETIVIDSV